MKTIVINTSKEAKETNLDILFKAPFDQSSLLWYDTALTELGEMPAAVKQALITNADIVDRDYQLIVLVDLSCFPRGNDRNYVEIYKPLLLRYIGVTVVQKLHDAFNLLPIGTSVYFADSSKYHLQEIDYAASNPAAQDAQNRDAAAAYDAQQHNASTIGKKGEELPEFIPSPVKPTTDRSPAQRYIMELFGWTESMSKDSIGWKLAVSIMDESFLDFYPVFEIEAKGIDRSSADALIIGDALKCVEKVTAACNTAKATGSETNGCTFAALPGIADRQYTVNSLTYHFARDNAQNLIEGFFGLFANIFACVQSKQLADTVILYAPEHIRQLLVHALLKYEYFSKEEHIPVEFEPIEFIFEKRHSIYKLREQRAAESGVRKGAVTDEDVQAFADKIIAESKTAVLPETSPLSHKLKGVDKKFFAVVEDVFSNYDEELIRTQNAAIVKNCLSNLWSWRDKQTAEDFRQTVVDFLKSSEGSGHQTASTPQSTLFMQEEYERELLDILDEVTEAEHKLVANRNILTDVKNLILKYSDLMRKGKSCLLAAIGSVLTILLAMLPYIAVQSSPFSNGIVNTVLYTVFTAGFAVLYHVAIALYLARLGKQKRELLSQIEVLRQQSEEDRRDSIQALYIFYNRTIIKAENHRLLWRDIMDRSGENAKKGIKRNNHIKRFESLADAVRRFLTKLKLDADDSKKEYDTPEETKKLQSLILNIEESVFSKDTQEIYSIISANAAESVGSPKNGKEA